MRRPNGATIHEGSKKMTVRRISVAAGLAALLALGACTDQLGPAGDKTKNGALIGAGAGALIGALAKDDGSRTRGALKGALVGSAVGAGVGYALDQQEADLRQSLGNNGVQITNTGDRLIVTLPQDILFASDSSAVRPDLQRDLGAVASNLQAYPNSTIQVVGHTDSDGEADYNQTLSESRARAVSNVLIGNGVAAARVQSFGRGESQPLASNLNPQGKAQNRRVEIVILPNAS